MRKNLQRARAEAGFTQYSFAKEIGVSRSYYSMLESGQKNVPRGWQSAIRLKLNNDADNLFHNTDEALRRGHPYKSEA